MEDRQYISSETAAQLIGVTRRSINRQIKCGRLQSVITPTVKGGSDGTANKVLLEDVLRRSTVEQRMLWYLKLTCKHCKGSPASFTLKDGDFFAPEYTIKSRPKKGEKPMSIAQVEELPS